MFSMLLKLLLIFSICLIIELSNESSLNEKCYFINQKSNETWKLVWQDNFQSESYLKQNWVIDQGSCDDWDSQISCNVKDNVKLQEGFLVMSAKEEKYGQEKYTGARLTTNRVFGYGRYEVRAALSRDEDVWSYFYTHFGNSDRDGFFIIHEFDDFKISNHGAVFHAYYRIDKVNELNIMYGSFHLFGMEWAENEVKFFIDDHYSEIIKLRPTRMVETIQQIRLWQGVRNLEKLLPYKLKWKCPLYILDYVRVYEKVQNVGLKVELCDEQNDVHQSSENQRKLVNSFCGFKTISETNSTIESMNEITTQTSPTNESSTTEIINQPISTTSTPNSKFENSASNQNSKSFWTKVHSIAYATFGTLTLVLIAFIVYQRYRMNKMTSRLDVIELDNRAHHNEDDTNDDVGLLL